MDTWQPELAELARRRALAAAMGGPERVARQHAAGRATARERIAALLDADSFAEVGALAGRGDYDQTGELTGFTPANLITGQGRLDGRRVVVAADDFTVRGGAADAAISARQVHAEQMAGALRVPLLRLLDGTGGGGSVKSLLDLGYTYLPWNPGWDQVVANLAAVPVISIGLGPVAGLGAARLAASHVAIGVRGLTQVMVAGPLVVAAGMGEQVDAEQLGGTAIAARAGTLDLVCGDEAQAFAAARQVLGYLPQHAWARPPVALAGDDPQRREPALRSLIPRDRRQPYDMRALLTAVLDQGSLAELGRRFAPSAITALGRLDGHPVAVLASDPRVYGGGMTADGADKITRFVDLAQTFSLPVLHVVDQPGFVLGAAAERAGTIRHGVRSLSAIYRSTVPWASVVVRRAFGVAGAGHRPHSRHTFRIAWPSADWGSLPIEGGLQVAFKRRIAEAGEQGDALRAQLAAELEAVRSPFRTAEVFGVEDIVDPADTRPLLVDWAHSAYAVLASEPAAPQPVYRG